MELKDLNIPKLDVEKYSYSDRAYLLEEYYSKIIDNSEIGNMLLSEYPKIKDLEGQMIGHGFNAQSFYLHGLARWFLWAINKFGYHDADKYLNDYLDASDIPVLNTLWISGIEVDEPISVSHNITIMPIAMMPDSREKEEYLKVDITIGSHTKPSTALIITTKSAKIRNDDFTKIYKENKELFDSSDLLRNLSIILNAFEGISCSFYYSTVYLSPQTPMPFIGGGGSYELHDTMGDSTTKITQDMQKEINILFTSFLQLSNNQQNRFYRILSRLSQSKQKRKIEDKMLDLGIALEMLLLDDDKNQHQLALSFRLRGSWLIASDEHERQLIYRHLRDIYTYRSQVAHGGILCGNDREKIQEVKDSYVEYEKIASRIIKKLICEGKPDWSKLILGIV